MKKEKKCEACKFNEQARAKYGESIKPIRKCTCKFEFFKRLLNWRKKG